MQSSSVMPASYPTEGTYIANTIHMLLWVILGFQMMIIKPKVNGFENRDAQIYCQDPAPQCSHLTACLNFKTEIQTHGLLACTGAPCDEDFSSARSQHGSF